MQPVFMVGSKKLLRKPGDGRRVNGRRWQSRTLTYFNLKDWVRVASRIK